MSRSMKLIKVTDFIIAWQEKMISQISEMENEIQLESN